MTTYTGLRRDGHVTITVGSGEGTNYYLPPRLDLFDYGATWFEWGYGGSGPSQTALAVLAPRHGRRRLRPALASRLHGGDSGGTSQGVQPDQRKRDGLGETPCVSAYFAGTIMVGKVNPH